MHVSYYGWFYFYRSQNHIVMSITTYSGSEVSQGLLSKATHALGLEETVPCNDKVYSVKVWEAVIESIGRTRNCTKQMIDRAKSRYTYYMLYHYAPGI